MTHVFLPAISRCFYLRNNELVKVKIIKVINVKDEIDNSIKVEIIVSDGTSEFYTTVDSLYFTEKDFKKGEHINLFECDICNVIENLTIDDDHKFPYTFILDENGIPQQVAFNTDRLEFDGYKHLLNNPFTETFKTREDAFQSTTYKVITNDGEKEVIGAAKLLQLTDRQKELVEKLKSLIFDMAYEGIDLAIDDNDNLYAFNISNVNEPEILDLDNGIPSDFEVLSRNLLPKFLVNGIHLGYYPLSFCNYSYCFERE